MTDFEKVQKTLDDLAARLDSLDIPNKDEIRKSVIEAITTDTELGRRLKFGTTTDNPALLGSKFARWGLGVADVEFLNDLMTAQSQKGYAGPSEELQKAFGDVSKAFYMDQEEVKRIDRQALDNLFPRVSKANGAAYERALKAMDSAESGYGQQLMGAQYVASLWETAQATSRVFGLINSFEMTAPTAHLPVAADIPEMLFVGESTADNATNYATSATGSNKVTVDAKKFVIHQIWSGELEEDSIIPFVPFLREQAAMALAHYLDSLVLNGDNTAAATGNINSDDGAPAGTRHYLAFDGLRHGFLVDNTANGVDAAGVPTLAALMGLRAKMIDAGKLIAWGYPTNPEDLVYITDYLTAEKISQISDVLTVDKYGQAATILTGEVAKIGRHPLVMSMAMALTAADGKVNVVPGATGTDLNTKGQVVAFNRRSAVAGWRRRIKLETERLVGTDQTRLVYSMRAGFGRHTASGAASGIEGVAGLYNLTV